MRKEEKIKELRERLPLFWNSYQHMYDVRERRSKGMIDFLLVISTFLPLLSATLYASYPFKNLLILFPIIPQIASIVILLKYFVIGKESKVHWFEVNKDKKLLNSLKNGDLEIDTISELKGLERHTRISMHAEGKLIRKSRALILISLFMLFLSTLFILFNGNLYFYITVLVLVVISFYTFSVFYAKVPDYSRVEEDMKEVRKTLYSWINEKDK